MDGKHLLIQPLSSLLLFNPNLFGIFAVENNLIKQNSMLLFDYYIEEQKDRAWFDSSNVIYGECDESDTQEKTVRLTFKNGLVYQYDNVNVYDWALFKGSNSQGKALNEIFKANKYTYKRLDEKMDVDLLKEELEFRSNNGMTLSIQSNGTVNVYDNKDKFVYTFQDGDNRTETVKGMLEALNYKVKTEERK